MSQVDNLTSRERVGIAEVNRLHQEAVDNGDKKERGFRANGGEVDESFVGTDISVPQLTADVIRNNELTGHTHEIFANGANEYLSYQYDRPLLRTLPEGGQHLLRTPSGAIRSLRREGGNRIFETLRGDPIIGYPARGPR